MSKLNLTCRLLLIIGLLFSSAPLRAEESDIQASVDETSSVSGLPLEEQSVRLMMTAIDFLGTPYKLGGMSAGGVDCSGFVKEVFARAFDVVLPRTALAMSKLGTVIQQQELQIGDLIFFNTMGRPYSHVAIYLGQGRFIHASSLGNQVKIDSLDAYYQRILNGFRRIELPWN